MTVTFEQARRAVLRHLAPTWKPELGSLTTLSAGYESPHEWRVIAGPREALIGGDLTYSITDFPAMLVDKQTGRIRELPVVTNFDVLDAMTPYGHASRR